MSQSQSHTRTRYTPLRLGGIALSKRKCKSAARARHGAGGCNGICRTGNVPCFRDYKDSNPNSKCRPTPNSGRSRIGHSTELSGFVWVLQPESGIVNILPLQSWPGEIYLW
jgi:hypothetical protein